MIKLKDYEKSPPFNKDDMEDTISDLQERLFILFRKLYQKELSAIIIIEGWAGSGKGDLIQNVTMRLDPRKMRVFSYTSDDYYPDGYHFLKKFWSKLPSYGNSAIYNGSWYGRVCYEFFNENISHIEYNSSFRSILNFEKNLLDDRYLIFKYFLNISQKYQEKLFKKAKKTGKNWMISKSDKIQSKNYNKFKDLIEIYLNQTNTDICPWEIVSAEDRNFSKVCVMESIVKKLENVLNIDSVEYLRLIKKEGTKN